MEIDPAATAWVLACTALVLLMTPGLAIFYGGMVRSTGVLNMIMMCFISIPVVTIAWLLAGYSLAFGQDAGGGLIGNLDHFGLLGIDPTTVRSGIPELLFVTFQLGFAIVTAALVCGAIADRARFSAWMIYIAVWTVAIYAPVAHWVWGPDGWLASFGAVDYAGGLVVEIVSGASALALALVLGPRIGFKSEAMRPHNLPFVLLGVGSAVVRLVRLQRGLSARRGRQGVGGVPQHADRRVPRNARLDLRRASPRRSADDVRCGVGRDRRTRRDHAGVRIRRPDRRIRRRARRRCGVFVRGRLEVQGGL